MKAILCSAFRNAVGYIDRYVEQVEGLRDLLERSGDTLDLILGYGDSGDGTAETLAAYAPFAGNVELVDVSHGGPHFGSVVHPQRFRQLAAVGNALWSRIPEDAGAAVWLESDLIWLPSTIATLIDRLDHLPAVAPMVMQGSQFYDIWGFRRGGEHFTNEPPYHPDLDGAMLQVDSAGSCLAVRGVLARQVNFPEENVIVGLSKQIYQRGRSVWCDPGLRVEHP